MTNSSEPAANRYLLTLIVAAAVTLAVGYSIRHTVSSFLFSFVLAYLLDPFVVLCERKNIRRTYGIVILYLVLGVLSFFFFIYFIPLLSLRWQSLLRDLPLYVQQIKEIILSWEAKFQPTYAKEEWQWLMDSAVGRLDAVMGKVGAGLYAVAGRMAFNLFNLILAPILVFFMLMYKPIIKEWLVSWIPSPWRSTSIALGKEINDSIGGYIRGQLIVSVIVAVLSTGALIALGIDYPLLNGIFAGLASVLPFIGVILATLPPLLFAFIKYQNGLMLLKVVGAFSLIYFLEGYLVKPLVFKKAMNLNPLVTIIAVMAFGELLGFWGILLAVPIIAAAKIVTIHMRRGDFSREG